MYVSICICVLLLVFTFVGWRQAVVQLVKALRY